MKSFKDHRYILAEDESTDRMYRAKALDAYTKVKTRLPVLMADPDRYFFKRDDGGLIASAEHFGLGKAVEEGGPLYLLFLPHGGYTKGGLGFFQGVPVLVFYSLLGPHDSRFLDTRLSKDVFIHEFIHYLDWLRVGKRVGRNSAAANLGKNFDPQNYADYINTPAEFNAYYQEAVSTMERLADVAPYSALVQLFGTNLNQFIKIAKEKRFPDGFISSLNPSYMRKLEKRLVGFWQETLNPKLEQKSGELE